MKYKQFPIEFQKLLLSCLREEDSDKWLNDEAAFKEGTPYELLTSGDNNKINLVIDTLYNYLSDIKLGGVIPTKKEIKLGFSKTIVQ